MKHWMMAAALVCFCSTARAQITGAPCGPLGVDAAGRPVPLSPAESRAINDAILRAQSADKTSVRFGQAVPTPPAPGDPNNPTTYGMGAPAATAVQGIDLSSISGLIREDFVYDQHGDKLFGVHIPVVDFHDAAGDEVVNLNLGLLWAAKPSNTSNFYSGSPTGVMASATARIDYLAKKWNGNHVTIAAIPKLEVGPFGGYSSVQKAWLAGGMISTTFGK